MTAKQLILFVSSNFSMKTAFSLGFSITAQTAIFLINKGHLVSMWMLARKCEFSLPKSQWINSAHDYLSLFMILLYIFFFWLNRWCHVFLWKYCDKLLLSFPIQSFCPVACGADVIFGFKFRPRRRLGGYLYGQKHRFWNSSVTSCLKIKNLDGDC